ncbi:MAG: ACT domain-containing protein [Clostridia bacterium]|nr:ACT domain-containing protein [Clostridia bacterium]
MLLEVLQDNFCVCKINSVSQADMQSDFFFLAKTDGEVSLVCKEQDAPKNCVAIEKDWRGIRVVGALDFALVGILSRLSTILANAGIPIFAVSTYDTDYILVKENCFDKALSVLKDNGYFVK